MQLQHIEAKWLVLAHLEITLSNSQQEWTPACLYLSLEPGDSTQPAGLAPQSHGTQLCFLAYANSCIQSWVFKVFIPFFVFQWKLVGHIKIFQESDWLPQMINFISYRSSPVTTLASQSCCFWFGERMSQLLHSNFAISQFLINFSLELFQIMFAFFEKEGLANAVRGVVWDIRNGIGVRSLEIQS